MEVAIDVGKRKSYVVVQNDGIVEREGYVETTEEGFDSIIPTRDGSTFIIEAGSSLYHVVGPLERRNGRIIVAHPAAMKLIAKAPNKTDKNDAHKLLNAYNANYLPRSYLPSKEVREDRNLCSVREFVVRQRAAIKNRIRYEAHRSGIELGSLTKKSIAELKVSQNLPLKELAALHQGCSEIVSNFDDVVEEKARQSEYAKLIDTIPGIGSVSALLIASQIADIGRFPTEFHLFSYAGLCPSTHQSGGKDWKGHVKPGNMSLRSTLIECVWIHIACCDYSTITETYRRLSARMGPKKAAVACAKRMARIIYYMLIRNKPFSPYGVGR